jgi:hypothetical protein
LTALHIPIPVDALIGCRIVMINCHPIEFGFKVAFDLRHEVTDEGFRIMQLWTCPQLERFPIIMICILRERRGFCSRIL